MAYTKTVLSPDPTFLQAETYDARSLRKFLASIISEGVEGSGDYAVTVASGLQLAIAPGVAYVLGENVADQGMYRQYISALVNINVGAHHATLPRLDQIILRVMDNTHDAAGANEGRIEVVPGTATAGATLVNRNGANPLTALDEASKNFILLADVLVPATSGALTLADRRVRSRVGDGLSLSGAGFRGFSAHANAAQSPAASTWTKVQYNTEGFDSDGWYDPTTNFRYTPLVAGNYRLSATVFGNASIGAGVVVQLAIYKNGAIHAVLDYRIPGAVDPGKVGGEVVVEANGTTDFFEVFYHQSDSVARQINGGAGNVFLFNRFQGVYLGE